VNVEREKWRNENKIGVRSSLVKQREREKKKREGRKRKRREKREERERENVIKCLQTEKDERLNTLS
jgi:hypothetical protein